MAISSGSVSLSTSTPSVIYATPDGVETTLAVQVTETENYNAWVGGSGVASGGGIELVSGLAPVVLTGFTGTLYGIAQSGSTAVVYIAADIK